MIIIVQFSIIVFFKTQAAVNYYYEHDKHYKEYNQPVNDILLKLDEYFVVSYEQNEENEGNNIWKVTVDQNQVRSSSILL